MNNLTTLLTMKSQTNDPTQGDPKENILYTYIFDPRRITSSNCKSEMVENMDNIVMEDKITQGEFQQTMMLLADIYSLGQIKPIDMDQMNNTYEDYQ